MPSDLPIILVCGFGRCGSSLVMQMLAAGGLLVFAADYPEYETFYVLGLPQDRDWLHKAHGHAVKIIDPINRLSTGGWGHPCRSIWLDRNPTQQARSIAKFMRHTLPELPPMNRAGQRNFLHQMRRDRPQSLSLLRSMGPVLVLGFEAILADPRQAAKRLAVFSGGGLDTKAMAAAVVPRRPECLPYMLETRLLYQRLSA